MFDIGWGELVVIGAVALIVIGPKELPTVLRTVGQWMTKIRRMASEFQGQFQEAMREAELSELKKQVDSANDLTKGMGDFNPIETARKEMESAFETGTKPAAPSEPVITEPITPAAPAPAAETVAAAPDPEANPPATSELPSPAAADGGRAA